MFINRQLRPLGQARQIHAKARRNNGSTLIEVLVALLLLSFTLLGIAGLLAATTRYQLGVDGRSKITLIYNDLTGRLRTNWTQSASYVYNTDSWADQQAALPTRGTNCSGTTACTAAERATDDVWEMRNAVRNALPQGSLLVAGDAANGLTTTFLWFDKDNSSDGSALRQSATCTTSMTPVQRHTCCPTVAAIGSTAGVRCLNFTFIR